MTKAKIKEDPLFELEEHRKVLIRQWIKEAEKVVEGFVSRKADFTADDVWAELELRGVEDCPEARALGNILRTYSNRGVITKDVYVTSKRRQNHGRPIPVWKITGEKLAPAPQRRMSNEEKLRKALKSGWHTIDELALTVGVSSGAVLQYVHYLRSITKNMQQKREGGLYTYHLATSVDPTS